MIITTDILPTEVARAVKEGFAKIPKRLPSWLFYDEAGDKIFQAIMRMPEYYLTPCEYEILQANKDKLYQRFTTDGSAFDLIELGAGDGLKTEILLRHFQSKEAAFRYLPVDVSSTALSSLTHRLADIFPKLAIQPVNKQYNEAIRTLYEEDLNRKVFLFLGANIGNFQVHEAENFVTMIASGMHPDDQLLIGFDLKKDPRLVQAAYDDPHGITRNFNMNLLIRLNRELGAQFQLDQFRHYPYYDPESGMTKSYLVSLRAQDVYIEAFQSAIHFDRWEVIHTEVSQKYDIPMIEKIASVSGLEITDVLYDCKHYFCDVLFKKKNG
ncbi:MAG TPA: L-histidine N(alpha)-methyltransferase [Ohtaekwangia sp.]|uniref:L-histidine N(alpha)-methyltransferase n=1 Tax=Ohtaekwangia sp. TaxID=2066019 RepID=UPI002F9540BD